MINPLYEPFPETVTADGVEYPILTDFREWIRFADMLNDKAIADRTKLVLMTQWFEITPERITGELFKAVVAFYRADALGPEKSQYDDCCDDDIVQRPPLLDWKYDAKYIIGDFLRCYGIDLLTAEMHWWHFRCLFSALPEDSTVQKRIAYRSVDAGIIKNEKERQRILAIQRQIAIPFEYDEDMIAAALKGTM
jgi:hypothetical protein